MTKYKLFSRLFIDCESTFAKVIHALKSLQNDERFNSFVSILWSPNAFIYFFARDLCLDSQEDQIQIDTRPLLKLW